MTVLARPVPKVLMLLSDTEAGGAQRTMINLANRLYYREDLSVELAIGRRGGPAEAWIAAETPIVDLKARRVRELPWRLARLVDDRKPDVMMSTMVHANIAAIASRYISRHRPGLVLRETNSHQHRSDLSRIMCLLAGFAYRRSDRIVALSKGVAEELIAEYGLDPGRTTVIHNPVVLEPFHQAARNRTGQAALPRRFVSVGRLVEQKNFGLLLDAFRLGAPRGATLRILGEGPERQALENKIRALQLQDRVEMPGHVDDIPSELAKADVFLLSSRWEGFGHVIVEALASSLPVIVTDCPYGPRDILAGTSAGLLVANGDREAFADAIRRISAQEELFSTMRAAARSVAERFDADAIATQYREAILAATPVLQNRPGFG